jgi:hypothetical protein
MIIPNRLILYIDCICVLVMTFQMRSDVKFSSIMSEVKKFQTLEHFRFWIFRLEIISLQSLHFRSQFLIAHNIDDT